MDWTPVQGEFLPLIGGLLGWAPDGWMDGWPHLPLILRYAFFFTWFDTGDQLATLVYNV